MHGCRLDRCVGRASRMALDARGGRARCWTAVFTGAVLLASASDLRAQDATRREYEIKAAFLFHFGQFVRWGPTEFSDTEAPFVIGVLGHDPFGPTLDTIVGGATIHDRPVVVYRYATAEEIERCQILFVSSSEEPRLADILARLAGRGTLTVGDAERFAERSGMIGFLRVGNRLQLEINLDAVTAEGLEVSSKLLQLARIVRASEGLPKS